MVCRGSILTRPCTSRWVSKGLPGIRVQRCRKVLRQPSGGGWRLSRLWSRRGDSGEGDVRNGTIGIVDVAIDNCVSVVQTTELAWSSDIFRDFLRDVGRLFFLRQEKQKTLTATISFPNLPTIYSRKQKKRQGRMRTKVIIK